MAKNDFGQDGSIKEFFSFLDERQAIYERRQAGQAWPWTDDPILRDYYFCNVFREQDKVTAWIRKYLREPIMKRAPKAKMPSIMIFNMALARFFNYIPTLEYIGPIGIKPSARQLREFGDTSDWDLVSDPIEEGLISLREENGKIFSDAYLVAGSDLAGKSKIVGVLDRLDWLWGNVDEIVGRIAHWNLENVWKHLQVIPGVSGFLAYEIVTDLRHTPLLYEAEDIMTWANPGPGAKRGIQRIYSRGETDYLGAMRILLRKHAERWTKLPLEMRDIEHSLCEYDKMLRIKQAIKEGGPVLGMRRYKHG